MKKFLSKIIPHLPTIYKIIALVVTVGIIQIMFYNGGPSTTYSYPTGSFWAYDDLFAPFDFTVSKSEKDIASEKATATQQSFLYYSVDSLAPQTCQKHIDNSNLSILQKTELHRVADAIYKKGYLQEAEGIDEAYQHTIILLQGNIGSEHPGSDFVSPHQVENYVASVCPAASPEEVRLLTDQLKSQMLVPSLVFDPVRTKLELDSRLSQINYASHMVQKGELIVKKGDYLDEDKCLEIDAYVAIVDEQKVEEFNPFLHHMGQFFLSAIAFIALFMFLKITQHHILDDNRKITFVFVTVVLMSGVVALIERLDPEWVLLAPICIVPILMRVFFDMRVALYIHLTVVIILGNLVPNSYEFIFYQLVTGMMSLITVKNFERRSDFFVVALTIFLTYSFIYTAGILTQDTTLANADIQRYLVFFLNALLTLMAYPLIYLFERLFGMTTNLTLLEISSTNTPALRELSRVAPGTFQHSMQVANISEDIISEIGGNALLARVGALYHDIGKTQAPLFFTENQNSTYNPHNDMDSEESAAVIIAHVREGIALGKKYHLPSEIIDFIRTHHGTTKTGYFYAQWVNNHPGMEPDPAQFQYMGPRPFSRETAVVMLVDSCEAATKSLSQPTKENIYQMVNSIIDGKIKDNQLAYCNLTFGDLNRIRELLVEKISSVFHVRVSYPTVNTPNSSSK